MERTNSSLGRLFLFPCLEAARNTMSDLIGFQGSGNEKKAKKVRFADSVTVHIIKDNEESRQPVQYSDITEASENKAGVNLEHVKQSESRVKTNLSETRIKRTMEFLPLKQHIFNNLIQGLTQNYTSKIKNQIELSNSVLIPKSKAVSLKRNRNIKSKRSTKNARTSKHILFNKKQLAHQSNQIRALNRLNSSITLNVESPTRNTVQCDSLNSVSYNLPFNTCELDDRQSIKGLEQKLALINRERPSTSNDVPLFRVPSSLGRQVNNSQPERIKTSRIREVDPEDRDEDGSHIKRTKSEI